MLAVAGGVVEQRHDDQGHGSTIIRLAVIAAALLAAGSAGRGDDQDPTLLTYSGPFADNARQIDNGVQLYIKQHGDTVAGQKIEIIKRDTTGAAPDIAKRLAQELVTRDKVDFLPGFVLTPNALAVADVATEAKVPMVS